MGSALVVNKLKDYNGGSMSDLEREIGVSKGRLVKIASRDSELNADIMKTIVLRFPEISPDWLITGEGEMLRKKQLNTFEDFLVSAKGFLEASLDEYQKTVLDVGDRQNKLVEFLKIFLMQFQEAHVASLHKELDKLLRGQRP